MVVVEGEVLDLKIKKKTPSRGWVVSGHSGCLKVSKTRTQGYITPVPPLSHPCLTPVAPLSHPCLTPLGGVVSGAAPSPLSQIMGTFLSAAAQPHTTEERALLPAHASRPPSRAAFLPAPTSCLIFLVSDSAFRLPAPSPLRQPTSAKSPLMAPTSREQNSRMIVEEIITGVSL